MNDIEQLLKTTLAELKSMVNPQTVVGNPISVEGVTIIPLVRAGFGFGTGGGGKNAPDGKGGGTGGGANVTPIALIVIDTQGGVRIEPLSKDAAGNPVSSIDMIVETITSAIKSRVAGAQREANQSAPPQR